MNMVKRIRKEYSFSWYSAMGAAFIICCFLVGRACAIYASKIMRTMAVICLFVGAVWLLVPALLGNSPNIRDAVVALAWFAVAIALTLVEWRTFAAKSAD